MASIDENSVYFRINSKFSSREEVVNAIIEEDIRDILFALIWKHKKTWFKIDKLLEFWASLSLTALVDTKGIFADVFFNYYWDQFRSELPAELQESMDRRIETIRGVQLLALPKMQGMQRVSSTRLLPDSVAVSMAIQASDAGVSIQQCCSFYNDQIGSVINAKIIELSGLYNKLLDGSKKILCAEINDPDYQDFYNNRVEEMNLHLENWNRELEIQRGNYERVCEVTLSTQARLMELINDEVFSKSDMLQIQSGFIELLKSVEDCRNSQVSICVCGETNAGKTTLIAGIVRSTCFPTSDESNSACPIRIALKRDPATLLEFSVPEPFKQVLETTFIRIREAIQGLRAAMVPADMPNCVTSKEAIQVFDLCADNSAPLLEFPTIIGDEVKIRKSIEHINGLIRLVYNLKGSPRFAGRLARVHPLNTLLQAPDILAMIPVVTSYCMALEGMPFLGQINIIDTPGVSEHGDRGTFMEFTKAIVTMIFEKSSRTIILTTPTTTTTEAFKELRALVRSRVGRSDKVVIAVNKFDQAEAPDGYELVLAGYRVQFAPEGHCGVNVQVLKAKILRDIVFGYRDIMALGGMENVTQARAQLSVAANSLITELYGATFFRTRRKMNLSDEDLASDCTYLSQQSNFANIIRVSLQPAFQAAMEQGPIGCTRSLSTIISGAINSINTRIASIRKKAEALQILQASINEIDRFLERIPTIQKEIETSLYNSFWQVVKSKLGRTKDNVDAAIRQREHKTETNLKIASTTAKTSVTYTNPLISPDPIKFETKVMFGSKLESEKENEAIISCANTVIANANIENDWETRRSEALTSQTGQIAKYLGELEQSIFKALSSDITSDVELNVVYDGIKNQILSCYIPEDIPPVSTCHCVLDATSPVESRDREGFIASILKYFGISIGSDQFYIPLYEPIKIYCRARLDEHYSDVKCQERVEAGSDALTAILENVRSQLNGLKERLSGLLTQINVAVQQEDEEKLCGIQRELTNSLRGISHLKQAIERRKSLDQMEDLFASADAEMSGLRSRMSDLNKNVEELMGNIEVDSPFRELFADLSELNPISYTEATTDLLNMCHLHVELRDSQIDLTNAVAAAMEAALYQFKKGRCPACLSVDELASLKLYTLQSDFYRLANSALRQLNVPVMMVFRKIIWLIREAMQKLPAVSHQTVFRGVQTDGTAVFEEGKVIMFPAFTSTSSSMNIATSATFLGKPLPGEVNPRLFFVINLSVDGAGRSLRDVSSLNEDEILLPPFSTFEVKGVSEVYSDGRQDVHLMERPYTSPFSAKPPTPASSSLHFDDDDLVAVS